MVSASAAGHTAGPWTVPARRETAESPQPLALAHEPLPPRDRPAARLTVLDITKWFAEGSGGVRTYLSEKARYVSARAHLRHVLVVPGPFDAVSVGEGVRTYRLRGPRIPTQTAYRFLLATRSTRRLVLHEQPTVIEVGSPFVVPWVTALASRGLGTPLVAFHHTSLAALPRSLGWHSRWLSRAAGAYVRRLGRLFRTTIVASQFAADELRRVGIERVSHVPLGVDLAHFNPRRAADRERTRRRLGLPLDRPVVLYVGRLAREKGLEVAMDAWRHVAQVTGAQLVVAGAGSHAEALRRRAGDAPVTWIPYLADRDLVAQLHGAADVYLSPGEMETFGLSALEAMASGVPVVSAAAGGGWELVQRSQAGVGYEPGSPHALQRAVEEALGSRHAALSANARPYAEREHGWTAVFDRLFALYHEVLSS